MRQLPKRLLLIAFAITSFLYASIGETKPANAQEVKGQFDSQVSQKDDKEEGVNGAIEQPPFDDEEEIQIESIRLTRGVDLSIAPRESAPESFYQRRMMQENFGSNRVSTGKSVQWKSGAFAFNRLMFEEPLLERYGLTECEPRQTIVSGMKFFSKGFLLPLDLLKGRHNCPQESILINPMFEDSYQGYFIQN